MAHLLDTFRHRQEGSAMVEVALFLPVIILLMLAMLDFGVILNQDLRVADSARSAAESISTNAYAANTGVASVVAYDSATGIPGYTTTYTTYCTCANGAGSASCTNYASCGSYGIPNRYIKVTASATLPLIFGIKGLPANVSVQSIAIARTPWTGGY